MNITFQNIIDTAPEHIKETLEALKTMRERPDFHPEPSAWHHIEIVVNRGIQIGDPDLFMAGFYHDIHKLDTMKINPKSGHPTSPGHDKWAEKTIEKDTAVQNHIKQWGADVDIVKNLCGQHMRMHQFPEMKKSKQEKMKDMACFTKLQVFSTYMDNMLYDNTAAVIDAQIFLKAIALGETPDLAKRR